MWSKERSRDRYVYPFAKDLPELKNSNASSASARRIDFVVFWISDYACMSYFWCHFSHWRDTNQSNFTIGLRPRTNGVLSNVWDWLQAIPFLPNPSTGALLCTFAFSASRRWSHLNGWTTGVARSRSKACSLPCSLACSVSRPGKGKESAATQAIIHVILLQC